MIALDTYPTHTHCASCAALAQAWVITYSNPDTPTITVVEEPRCQPCAQALAESCAAIGLIHVQQRCVAAYQHDSQEQHP